MLDRRFRGIQALKIDFKVPSHGSKTKSRCDVMEMFFFSMVPIDFKVVPPQADVECHGSRFYDDGADRLQGGAITRL